LDVLSVLLFLFVVVGFAAQMDLLVAGESLAVVSRGSEMFGWHVCFGEYAVVSWQPGGGIYLPGTQGYHPRPSSIHRANHPKGSIQTPFRHLPR
jgi:hypothetical protein